jgi:hypothetical protein
LIRILSFVQSERLYGLWITIWLEIKLINGNNKTFYFKSEFLTGSEFVCKKFKGAHVKNYFLLNEFIG